MPTYTFPEIERPATKTGKCTVCGRRATRRTTFTQTLNPWNKTADGRLKTVEEIRAELRDEAEQWKTKPVTHEACG